MLILVSMLIMQYIRKIYIYILEKGCSYINTPYPIPYIAELRKKINDDAVSRTHLINAYNKRLVSLTNYVALKRQRRRETDIDR